ncbi:hypothetical protein DITRI_Ditri02bG0040500 [Diplodiscus trichospermus]
MPNSTIMEASLAILLILSANAVNVVEAMGYAGRKTVQKRIDSRSIIHALAGYDLSAVKRDRRVLTDATRVSPGGPDPQHNQQPLNYLRINHTGVAL